MPVPAHVENRSLPTVIDALAVELAILRRRFAEDNVADSSNLDQANDALNHVRTPGLYVDEMRVRLESCHPPSAFQRRPRYFRAGSDRASAAGNSPPLALVEASGWSNADSYRGCALHQVHARQRLVQHPCYLGGILEQRTCHP